MKTHKTRELISLLIEHGVTRFKCATIAEAEVVASCGPTDIILAYPLVGPNVARFLALQQNFPNVRFWSIGDDLEQLRRVSDAAQAAGTTIRFMADVNVGQNRTGVALDKVAAFYKEAAAMEGLAPDGFHCYDGHIHQSDFEERTRLAAEIMDKVLALKNSLVADGYSCTHLVMGGTPTFPLLCQVSGRVHGPPVRYSDGLSLFPGLSRDGLYSRGHHHDPGHQPPDPQHLLRWIWATRALRRTPPESAASSWEWRTLLRRLPRARSTGYSRLRPAMRAKSRLWEASCL